MQSSSDVTGLLLRWSEGDADALDQLLPLVYAECRRIASRQMLREDADHTLAPTEVVHELYLRLIDQRRATWQNRAHFFGIAAQLMRRILVDHARARGAAKRDASRLILPEPMGAGAVEASRVADVLSIDEALVELAALDAEQHRIVELRFFAGLTVDETAQVVGRSPRTVKREWRLARAWLFRKLQAESP